MAASMTASLFELRRAIRPSVAISASEVATVSWNPVCVKFSILLLPQKRIER